MNGRRHKSNSISTAIEAGGLQRPVLWPGSVASLGRKTEREKAFEIFRMIIGTRSRADWRSTDIHLVAQVSNISVSADKCFHKISRANFQIKRVNRSGTTMIKHPLVGVWDQLVSRQMIILQKLGLTGLPTTAQTVRNHAKVNPAHAASNRSIADDNIDWVTMLQAEKNDDRSDH